MTNVDISTATKQVDINIQQAPKDINAELQSKADSALKTDAGITTTLKDRVTVTAKSEPKAEDKDAQKLKKEDKNPKDLSNIDLTRFSLRFETDKDLNIIIVKIVDKKSGEVVTQIPPEQTIKTLKYFEENPGKLVSTQA